MLKEAREQAQWSKECEALSMYHELSKLEDRRGRKGKRYKLALLLTCVLLAKMAGETTRHSIAEWIRLRSSWLQDVLPDTRTTFPCAATYSNVLRAVDPEQVNQVLMDLVIRVRAKKRTEEEHRHVVLDGKTLRGTQNHHATDQKKMHHVNVYEAKTAIVLKQHMVAEKEGELTRVQEFLTPVFLQGRIMSADALYAQTSFCQEVIAAGGDYLLFVKQNQPTFYEDVSLFFREPPLDCLDWRTASTTNKGHGRVENRLITVSTELNDACGSRLARSGTGLLLTETCPTCAQVYATTRVWHHQSHATTCRSCSSAGIDPGSLVHRKSTPTSGVMSPWVKMPAKSAKVQPLILLQFSIPLCSLSSISAASPTSNSRCGVWMLTRFKPSASCSSLWRKIK